MQKRNRKNWTTQGKRIRNTEKNLDREEYYTLGRPIPTIQPPIQSLGAWGGSGFKTLGLLRVSVWKRSMPKYWAKLSNGWIRKAKAASRFSCGLTPLPFTSGRTRIQNMSKWQ